VKHVGKIFGIATLDLRRLAHDRTALFFAVLLPVLIILIVGVSIGGSNTRLRIGVVEPGSGPLARELRSSLSRAPELSVASYRSVSDLKAAVRHQEILAGVVVPADYDARVHAGEPAHVDFVAGATPLSQAARSPVSAVVDDQAARIDAATIASRSTGSSFDAAYARAGQQQSGAGVGVAVTRAPGAAPLPQGFSYTAPSNVVLFVFIIALATSGVLIESRRLGITARMLATPTPPIVVLLGQSAGRFAVAIVEGVFLLTVGRLVFGVTWGDPTAAAAIVVMFSVVATGAALLIGAAARTFEQASSLGPPIGIALGMLGGCMWPLQIVPPVLRTVGHVTPQAWAMDGFIELIGRRGNLASIAPDLLVLAGFAVVLVPTAAWRLRRAL
jgi:ABC-2 type transport system permease protein